MAWWTLSNLRTILTTETDADSGVTEESYSQFRENFECLVMSLLDTGDDGSATSNPPNDSTGVLTDSAGGYDADEHNGKTLLITSGLAIGNLYTIDDGTATTLVCTGDNLYADGVRSGDTYKVLYDLKVNADGHDHDGVNSKAVGLADGQVTEAKIANLAVSEGKLAASAVAQSKLKTSTGSVNSVSSASVVITASAPGGDYGFTIQVKAVPGSGATLDFSGMAVTGLGTSYVTPGGKFTVTAGSGANTVYVQQRYITSSGEIYWVFIQRDKLTKDVLATWQSNDHPCFGMGSDPEKVPHPKFPGFDPEKHEIVCINPSDEDVKAIRSKAGYDKDFIEVLLENYDIDEKSEPVWPTKAVTVGLPAKVEVDGEMVPVQDAPRGTLITPIKRVIPKPKGILLKSLIKKKSLSYLEPYRMAS